MAAPLPGGNGPAGRSAVLRGPVRCGRFQREQLPAPLAYYAADGIELRGRGAWRDALCPFHADASPSLRVNAATGAFKCMACGAAGGDVLAFHQRRHGLGFVEAAQALGAWEGGR